MKNILYKGKIKFGLYPIYNCDPHRFLDSFLAFSVATVGVCINPFRLLLLLFGFFVNFKARIENRFSNNIQVFQINGGGDHIDTSLKNYLQTKGIIHQFSCLDMPQQNGLAERKIRHITEVGRALMVQGGPPEYFGLNFIQHQFI